MTVIAPGRVQLYDSTPATVQVNTGATAGSDTKAARGDHVHQATNPAAPTTSAVADVAAAGTDPDPARQDHTHGREAFAAPVALTFPTTNSAGAATTVSRSDHAHGLPSSWTKVAAGALGAVSALNLSGLSGYRRYKLIITARSATNAGAATMQLNGSAVSHWWSRQLSDTAGTASGTAGANVSAITLRAASGNNSDNTFLYDIEVAIDAQANRRPSVVWRCLQFDTVTNGVNGNIGWGVHGVDAASISQINITAFGVTLTDGEYVLYGSNEVA